MNTTSLSFHHRYSIMSLHPCPSCRKSISASAEACPRCGHPLKIGWVTAQAGAAETKFRSRQVKIGVILFSLVALAVFVNHIETRPKETPEQRRERYCSNDSIISASFWAQDFVRQHLKAPSTAEFSANSSKYVGNCEFAATGFVDAQNSFGAKIRSRYLVRLEYDPIGDKWRELNVVF